MNRPIKNALLTLIMVIVSAATVYGAAQPLAPSHEYLRSRCGVCHNSPDAASYAKNNVCLVCHRTGSVAPTNKQFFTGDMANPFGTTMESAEKDFYTHSSHEWSATDDNPAAGALPPVNPIMNQLFIYTGKLSCNRCHSMHLDPPLPDMTKQPMTNDELCLDCHRLRNTSSHVYGSHPVNIDYNAAVAKSPTKFAPAPVNSNPSNYSSKLTLLGTNKNMVMCSTCHKVHFSDSSSKTLDNFSTAMVGGLMPSKGYLLKTDYRYVNYTTHNSPNICTNCHIGKHEHNGGGQRVLCTDCHSGHVDYDVNATDAASMVPNVYMIKRYMNWSSPTGWKDNKAIAKQTFFQDATNKYYKRADGKGVCQSCHDVPAAGGISAKGYTYPEQHSFPTATANDCKSCHTHEGEWSFAGSCLQCHGQPPTATSAAAGYTGNEAISGHGKHSNNYSFKCLECHYDVPPKTLHNNGAGSFQDVYHQPEYEPAKAIASKYGSNPSYVGNACSNVYCHSNGRQEAMAWKGTPNWFGGSTDCNSCHDASPTTNAHGAHLAKGYVCQNCHAATVSGSSTIANKANHADGNVQLEFNSVSLPFALNGSNCGNVYCHSDGSGHFSNPDWRTPSTGQCGSCHDTLTRTSGAHQPHISASYNYGPKMAAFYNNDAPSVCENCHGPNYQTKHLNGTTVDVDSGRCSLSCHANGLGSAVWGGGRTGITCESCHTGTLSNVNGLVAPDKTLAATKGHNMNSSSTGVIMNYNCTSCHDANAKHIDGTAHDTRLLPAYTGALNTECNACHNNTTTVPTASKSQMYTHVTAYIGNKPDSNTAPSGCATCHDPHGTNNRNMIRAKIVASDGFDNVTCNISYKNSTSCVSDIKVGKFYTGLCQVCHTGLKYYNNTIQETVHNVGKNCFGCHMHKHIDNVYAFQPRGECDSCHGYPPVQTMLGSYRTQGNYSSARLQNYTGGGGVHDVPGHIPATATKGQAWSNCTNCHYGSDVSPSHTNGDVTKPSTINVQVNPKFKFDSRRPINYKGNRPEDRHSLTTGTCSNVSCHFQPSPKWSSEK